jgi:hypothetical protein
MKLLRALLGGYADLVVHVLQSTVVFIIILGCIYVARLIVPRLFPPGDYTSNVLHLVDSYATLLGTVGYVVWLSLDMFSLLRERLKKGGQKHNDERSAKTK